MENSNNNNIIHNDQSRLGNNFYVKLGSRCIIFCIALFSLFMGKKYVV